MKLTSKWFCLFWGIFFLVTSVSVAAVPTVGKIEAGTYPTVLVNHHTPEYFKNAKDYLKSLQRIELQLGGVGNFKNLPQLGMKNPYTGYIVLGDRQKFGVIVDIYGEEKRLYIDTDGDGSFANEPMTLLLNEWEGLQLYWVVSPEPLQLKVRFQDRIIPIDVAISGLLNQPGVFVKEKPYLMLQVKTWFLAKIIEDGHEKLVAIVDKNNNGRFDDPEDQLFIDYNENQLFNDDEMIVRKKRVKIKSGKSNLTVDWGPCPDQIIVGGEK